MTFRFDHVKFVRAVDGDTVVFDIDQGFRTSRLGEKFRLARIDAPEIGQPGGSEARDWLALLLVVTGLELRVTGQDKYGRWLAEIGHPSLGNVNDSMVTAGHAVYRSY